MASLALSLDGEMIREYEITKPRFTIGRRPYNDVPIDNLAVSGEHAAIIQVGNDLIFEDGGSTNGTLLNGTQVEKQLLKDGDVIEIGKYHLRFFAGKTIAAQPDFEKTMLIRSPFAGMQLRLADAPHAAEGALLLDAPTNLDPFPSTFSPEVKTHHAPEPLVAQAVHFAAETPMHPLHYALKVLNGKQSGVEIPLSKPLTSIGKKNVQVAMITRRPNGFFLNHVQGDKFPIVNGATLNERPCPLNPDDVIELAGVRMEFLAK
ncbi:MAG: FHA domain-containing protein [Burkholderiales bacterium]|nr:FHA domain-containing protein [Burkholderiales bacterium]